ncbi:MAG: ABC transporter permease [Chloroflexi bacterium]|nr:ABC transporter permease [Chloroflexota bacterium]
MPIQFTLAARYLWGRKLRTFLTTLAIVFGVLVIFSMNILLPTMLQAFQSSILTASGQVDLTITHKSGETFSTRVLDQVENVSGIRAASGTLERPVNIPTNFFRQGNVGAVSLIGLEPKAAQALRDYSVQAGRFLRSGDTNAAVITAGLADAVGLKLGDELPVPTAQGVVRFKIVGIRPAQALPGNEPVYVPLAQAQKVLSLPNRINTIQANYNTNDAAPRAVIEQTIQNILGSEYQLGGLGSSSELFASIGLAQQGSNLFGFLALFMGGFVIFNTFRTIVAERRRDIGMLRAVGASRRTIVALFLAEGLLQGILGTAIGIGMGYLAGVGITSLMSGMFEQFLHVQMGAPVVEPSLLIITTLLGIGVTLFSGLLPAWNASRVTPLEALRPSVADVEARKPWSKANIAGAGLIVIAILGLLSNNIAFVALGGFAFLIGLVLIAPVLVKPLANIFSAVLGVIFARQGTASLAQGNLTRQPSRAAITASATMIGLAIIVAVVGVMVSITGGIYSVLEKSLGSDYLLIPPSLGVWSSDVGADAALADRLRSVYGVGVVSTLRFASTTVNDEQVNLLGVDPVAFPQVSGLNFTEGDPHDAFAQLAQGRNLIVNGMTATQLKVKLGDTVKLSSPEGEQTYRIVGIGSDFINTKIMTAYTSQQNLKRDFHKTEDVLIQLNLAPGADAVQVEARLQEILAKYPQFKLISGKAYLQESQQLFDAAFSIYYVMLVVLALPSLIAMLNTLAIGVLERTREIGMLRAIGATRRQVRRTILTEALLLAATGTAFGLLGGLYLGYVMVLGMSASGIMPVAYSFPLAGILAAIAIGLLFGVIAALLPARQAAQMNIIRALRYE